MRLFLFLILFIALFETQAQEKIKLEPGAHKATGFRKNGINYTVITGNVKFTHKGSIFFCDSAVLVRKSNYLNAFGHIKIIDGDSIILTGNTLHYSGNTKIARLKENIVLTKIGQLQLFTDSLNYDRNTSMAVYTNGGTLIDSTNTLTSKKGYFNTKTSFISFKTKVVGTNKEKTIRSDTLVYNARTRVISFVAPTNITDVEGNVFDYTKGTYESKLKKSVLFNGVGQTQSYFLKGDKINLDDLTGVYTITGNVYILSKNDSVILTGQRAIINKATRTTKVFDSPLVKMLDKSDTLFMTADTLVSINSKEDSKKKILAFSNVLFFKKNMAGKSDSVAYLQYDSILTLYGTPVIWFGKTQLSGDTIDIIIKGNTLHKMLLYPKAFVASLDSLEYYNQIKGRTMTAWFKNKEIDYVNIYGNGESIFFIRDDISKKMIGMNTIICSNIFIKFQNNKLKNISFFVAPTGKLIPPQELKVKDLSLSGFNWRADEKPTKVGDLVNIKEKK